MIKSLIIGFCMLALAACTATGGAGTGNVPLGSLGQKVADAVIDVKDENRGLRVCWLAAGAVEVMTDLAQRGGSVQLALGHLFLLQGAIDKARAIDPLWIETDTADVALLFATVLKDVSKTRLARILLGGPTLSNFLNVAKRTVILTVKGHAVMRDINRVLTGVEDGTIDKIDAWKACEDRTAMNRNALRALSGGPTLSGVARADKSLYLAEGWRDEKRVPRNSGGEFDGVAEYPFEWIAASYGTQSEIGGTDYAGTFQDGWVDGGGTGPYAMPEAWIDPKDGDVTFGGWETVHGGSGDVIYTEFVAAWPSDGDVNASDWSLRAELDFIYKGDALVDGGSILVGRPIG